MVQPAKTVEIPSDTLIRLQRLAGECNLTVGDLITMLAEKYERERFWDRVSEDLTRFRADTEAYQQYRDEFAEWDNQINRALADEPPYYAEDSANT